MDNLTIYHLKMCQNIGLKKNIELCIIIKEKN